MRFKEIVGGLLVSISNEENAFVDKLIENGNVKLLQLSERDRELARLLTSRGIVKLKKEEGSIYVVPNLLQKRGDIE